MRACARGAYTCIKMFVHAPPFAFDMAVVVMLLLVTVGGCDDEGELFGGNSICPFELFDWLAAAAASLFDCHCCAHSVV